MTNSKQDTAGRKIKSVTYLGMVINLALSAIKIVIGVLAGSLALVADGIHSLSDLATDAAVLLGLHLGSKEPDQSHPYGHGRAETFSAGVIALVLIFVGGAMIYYATMAIARDEMTTPRFAVLVAAIVSIASKEWLYRITLKIAVQSHSPALYANAWHHRSDAFSSVAVAVGFVSLAFGFGHGDQVAAITVGLMIIWVGVSVISDALRELTEAAVDSDTIEHIKDIINSDPSIRQWHKLRTRMVGREVFLDLHILVDPDLNVTAAHEIAERLEKTVNEQIARPTNITVHIEPDTPEMRDRK
ncbi:MAG TPA: cation diffusion facilitator family transporter [Sedimentisphaerales bacterium]|nr:cation diffusion facilitator family transporter [Sedimentisphaerales bacterium]